MYGIAGFAGALAGLQCLSDLATVTSCSLRREEKKEERMKKGTSHVSFLISGPKATTLCILGPPAQFWPRELSCMGRPLSASTERQRRKWLCSLISHDLLFSRFHKIYDLRGKPSKSFLKDTDPRC